MSHIVLYDGVCELCNVLTRFVLRRDKKKKFRFVSLQSTYANQILTKHSYRSDMDTVYVVLDAEKPTERLLAKSSAMLFILTNLGGIWALAAFFKLFPAPILDKLYDAVAKRRYRWFGPSKQCALP